MKIITSALGSVLSQVATSAKIDSVSPWNCHVGFIPAAPPSRKRTRGHLFSKVMFRSAANLESRKQTFPDHSDSPACYTQILTVECPEAVKIADAGAEGGWIRAFSRVVRLNVHAERARGRRGISLPSFSLIPFHGFSHVLKRLCIICAFLPNAQIFDLISTLPLLKDLFLFADGLDDGNTSDSDSDTSLPAKSPLTRDEEHGRTLIR